MYVFSDDEKYVLVQDGHGATRLSAPSRVKTLADVPDHGRATLSRSADGTRVLLTHGGLDQSTVFEFPSMKAVHRYPKHENTMAALLPDGGSIAIPDFGMHVKELPKPKGASVFGNANPKKYTLGAATLFEALPVDEPLALGGTDEDLPRPMRPFLLAPTGRFCSTLLEPSELWLGTLEGQANVSALHRIPLTHGGGVEIDVYPLGEEYVVRAWSGRTTRVVIIQGSHRTEEDFAALAPPQVSRDWIAWQPNANEVICRSRKSGDEQRFDVSAVTERARTKSRKKKSWSEPPENQGRSSLLLGNERLLMVPWHGETIVDLRAETEVLRNLPKSPLRRALLQAIEEDRESMSEKGFAIWLAAEERVAATASTSFYLAASHPNKDEQRALSMAPKRWTKMLAKHGETVSETASVHIVVPREIPR